MPRQKLPEGYEYDDVGDVLDDEGYTSASSETGDIELFNADDEQSYSVQASVALAVIRNAGLDPLLDMAKRVVAEPMVTIEERLSELARLIKSMEEP